MTTDHNVVDPSEDDFRTCTRPDAYCLILISKLLLDSNLIQMSSKFDCIKPYAYIFPPYTSKY